MQPLNKKDICEAISTGNFIFAFDYLADDIRWNIVGDKILQGKAEVIDFCVNTAAYFASVDKLFSMSNLITDASTVVVNGSARFINKEKITTYISSCDIYHFNDEKLQEIISYCIVTGKK